MTEPRRRPPRPLAWLMFAEAVSLTGSRVHAERAHTADVDTGSLVSRTGLGAMTGSVDSARGAFARQEWGTAYDLLAEQGRGTPSVAVARDRSHRTRRLAAAAAANN